MRLFVLGAALLLAAGCETARVNTEAPMIPRFYVEASADAASARTAELPVSGVRLTFAAEPVLTERDIARVEIAQVALGRCLLFQLTPRGTRELFRVTASHQGRRLVLVLNGRALGARRIEAPIEDGNLAIFVEVPDAELTLLMRGVRQTVMDSKQTENR